MRFVTRTIHACLDYPVAIGLLILPFLRGLGGSHPLALNAAPVAGAAALVLTIFTNHLRGEGTEEEWGRMAYEPRPMDDRPGNCVGGVEEMRDELGPDEMGFLLYGTGPTKGGKEEMERAMYARADARMSGSAPALGGRTAVAAYDDDAD